MLMHIFRVIGPHVNKTTQNSLPQFKEFLIALIRLRLNLSLQDLAFRLNVPVPTINRIFDSWVHVMRIRLRFSIKWREREELQATIPVVFQRNFGKKASVIIDCFEVFIEQPSSLLARAMTWSNYKHHNTIKFIIGVTPSGSNFLHI